MIWTVTVDGDSRVTLWGGSTTQNIGLWLYEESLTSGESNEKRACISHLVKFQIQIYFKIRLKILLKMFNFSKLLPERKLKAKRGCYHFFFLFVGKKIREVNHSFFSYSQNEICLCREIDPVCFFSWNVPSSSLHAPYIPVIYYMMRKSVSQKINTLEPAVARSWGVLKWVLIWREKDD